MEIKITTTYKDGVEMRTMYRDFTEKYLECITEPMFDNNIEKIIVEINDE